MHTQSRTTRLWGAFISSTDILVNYINQGAFIGSTDILVNDINTFYLAVAVVYGI